MIIYFYGTIVPMRGTMSRLTGREYEQTLNCPSLTLRPTVRSGDPLPYDLTRLKANPYQLCDSGGLRGKSQGTD